MVNSTLSVVIRSATTGILAVVSGSRSHLWLYQHDNLKSGSVFDILKEHNADNAAYNSRERELEHAFTCQEGTRRDVIAKISAWSKVENGPPICWLRGPAGSGKSTVAHTIAAQCDHNQRLAFSFFFSRGKLDRSETTKFIPTFAYQLAKFFPAIQTSMQQALAHDPSILSQRLGDQIKKLIIYPVVIMTEPVAPMIVVIDGLDECGEKDSLQELVRLLVDSTTSVLFDFFLRADPSLILSGRLNLPRPNARHIFFLFRILVPPTIFAVTCGSTSRKYVKRNLNLCEMCRSLGRHNETSKYWSNNQRVYSSMCPHLSGSLVTETVSPKTSYRSL